MQMLEKEAMEYIIMEELEGVFSQMKGLSAII
jgi:hypothetical protein